MSEQSSSFFLLIFGCKSLVSSNTRLWDVFHYISCHVTAVCQNRNRWLGQAFFFSRKRGEVQGRGLCFCHEIEFKYTTRSGWMFLFLFYSQTLCTLWKHSSFLFPNLDEKDICSCYHQQKYWSRIFLSCFSSGPRGVRLIKLRQSKKSLTKALKPHDKLCLAG